MGGGCGGEGVERNWAKEVNLVGAKGRAQNPTGGEQRKYAKLR